MYGFTPRRQILLILAVGAGTLTLAVGLAVAGQARWSDALLAALLLCNLSLVLTLVVGGRRIDSKVQRLTWVHREHDTAVRSGLASARRSLGSGLKDIAVSIAERHTDVVERSARIEGRLISDLPATQRLIADLSRNVRQDLNSLSSLAQKRFETLTAGIGEARSQLQELESASQNLVRTIGKNYQQLESFVDLRSLLSPLAPMPALRGWSASPDVLRLLIAALLRRRPKYVLECGSGSSTVWLGHALKLVGTGRVIALEHDKRFAALSNELVRAHGLEDVAEIRVAPLEDWHDGQATHSWYASEAFVDLSEIGLLFVDGPPGSLSRLSRYPAVPRLLPRCTPDVLIVLDDTRRPAEREISDRWLAEHPELTRTEHRFEKGAHVFTRRESGVESSAGG